MEMAEESKYAARAHFGVINAALRDSGGGPWFTWGLVCNFGELQLLTRASYIMLILVPLLAGLWPSVTAVVNRYNATAETAVERLNVASQKLTLYAKGAEKNLPQVPNISGTLSELRDDLDKIANSLRTRSIEAKELPDVWALSFIAALCAVIAQTIYQMAAPTIVRGASMREYINAVLDQEMKMQGDGREVDPNAVKKLVLETSREYQGASVSNIEMGIASFLFYFFAVVIIAYIVVTQTYGVILAAGWV